MSIEVFWKILSGPINRIFGSGGLIAVFLYSIYTYFTIPSQKEYDPAESTGKIAQFNLRLKHIKILCWVNFFICICGVCMDYFAQSYINNSSGVITIESTGKILIILVTILAIFSFISSLIIRKKVSRLK